MVYLPENLRGRKIVRFVDLYCGAGGTTTAIIEVLDALEFQWEGTCFNHNPQAIATHSLNHASIRHYLANVDDQNPYALFKPDEVFMIWASPECTHHSVARGGRPMNDQSRCSAWCIPRWMEALRPEIVLLENVPEFTKWGPLDENNRPIKSEKSVLFNAWKTACMANGYIGGHTLHSAAPYGDPTTRRRLFIQFHRKDTKRVVVWPNPTHGPETRRVFRTAESDVIDFSLVGRSIFERGEGTGIPGLVVNTIKRILYGLEKFSLAPFLVPGKNERGNEKPRTHDVKKPLPTVHSGHIDLVEPFVLPSSSGEKRARSVKMPIHTVKTESRGEGLVEAFITQQHGTTEAHLDATAKSIEEPLGPVCAGGNHHGVATTFLVQTCHGNGREGDKGNARRVHSVKGRMPTVCGNRGDVAHISVLLQQQSGGVARPVTDAAPTVSTSGAIGKVDYIIAIDHQSSPESGAVRDSGAPLTNVTTKARHSLLESFLVQYYGQGSASSVKEGVPTVTTKERFAWNRAELRLATDGAVYRVVSYAAWRRLVIFQARKGKRLSRLFMQFDDEQGSRIEMLEVLHRMLQVHELAAAQGFRKDYKFAGTKTDQVKQIGNAVPRRLARAIVAAAITQNPDVSWLCDLEEMEEAQREAVA